MSIVFMRAGWWALVPALWGCGVTPSRVDEKVLPASGIEGETSTGSAKLASLRKAFGASFLPEAYAVTGARTAEVTAAAGAAFELADKGSAAKIRVELRGASGAQERRDGDAYQLFSDTLGKGTTLVQRILADGLEDFVHLPSAPELPVIEYRFTLMEGVAGLRQIGNTLELVDAGGAPRLRVNPPYLVDANRAQREVELEVADCAVDRDPSAPWGRPVVAPGARQCTVRLSWAADTAYPALIDPAWVTTGNTAVPRYGHTLTKLTDGRVLAVGGAHYDTYFFPLPPGYEPHTISQRGTTEAELYDPTTQTWSVTGAALGRHSHIAELLGNGEVLIAGGLDGTESFNETDSAVRFVSTAQRYNPSTGLWTSAASPLSGFRARASSTRLDDGTVLVSGGTFSAPSALSAETYNPANNTWTATSGLNRARAGHASVKLASGKVLIVGGDNESGAASELYDPATRAFSTLRTLPGSFGAPPSTELFGGDAGAVADASVRVARLSGGDVLAVGGRASRYDVATNAWRDVGAPLFSRRAHTLELLADGSVLAIGGRGLKTDDGQLNAERFRPDEFGGLWAPIASGGIPRSNARSVVLNSGRVLVQGGGAFAVTDWSANARVTEELTVPASPAVHVSDYLLPTGVAGPGNLSELRGRVYRPAALVAGQKYPLVLILHARGPACVNAAGTLAEWDNSLVGCPAGYALRPLHKGYAYLGTELARQGFVVVSPNWLSASKSDPDASGIEPIARAGAEHLATLNGWHTVAGTTPAAIGVDFKERLDFSQVALVGHSNGGAAAGSIPAMGFAFPITFRAVVGIAPVEGETGSFFDKPELKTFNWVGVFGSCDLDGGLWANAGFNRRATQGGVSTFYQATHFVPGANHNFFSTELTFDESTSSPRCGNHTPLYAPGAQGSVPQLQSALRATLALILGKVGPNKDARWTRTFEPTRQYRTFPAIENGYLESTLVLENFSKATGTSSGLVSPVTAFLTTKTGSVTVTHNAPPNPSQLPTWQPDGKFNWSGSATWNSYFKASGSGIDLSAYTWLDVSAAATTAAANSASTTFSVALVKSNGTVTLSQGLGPVTAPGGLGGSEEFKHKKTYRFRLDAFNGPLTAIRGVQLQFSNNGEVRVAHIRVTKPHE